MQQQLFKAAERAKAAKKRASKAEREAAAAARKLQAAREAERKAVAHHELVKVKAHTRRPPKKGGKR